MLAVRYQPWARCSVALLEGDKVLAHIFEAMDRGHAERLAPMVDEAMRGAEFSSLTHLAVTTGPGTFTRPARRARLHARLAAGAEDPADRRHAWKPMAAGRRRSKAE